MRLLQQLVACSRASAGLPGFHLVGGWDFGKGEIVGSWGFCLRESEIRDIRTDQVIIADKLFWSISHPEVLQNTIFQSCMNLVSNHSDTEAVQFCLWPGHNGGQKPLVGEE